MLAKFHAACRREGIVPPPIRLLTGFENAQAFADPKRGVIYYSAANFNVLGSDEEHLSQLGMRRAISIASTVPAANGRKKRQTG